MNWMRGSEEERAAAKRIVALLLSLADLAAEAGTRPPAVCGFVLWLLLAAEAVARNLVTSSPAPCPFHRAGTAHADAMRLARRFRNLARLLDRQADSDLRHDGIGHADPAWGRLRRMLQRADLPGLVCLHIVPAPMQDVLAIVGFSDTS